MKSLFDGFSLAINMLTILPFFKTHRFFKGINGYAVMLYPLVGFLLGSILWLLHDLLSGHIPSIHLNIIIFSMLVLFTGALHLDGFCDTIDGLFVSKDKALQVMKDPHIGGMGMIFGIVFLILKASAFVVFESFYLLPFVLALSRFNATLAIYFYPYITKKGMGSLAKDEFDRSKLIISFLIVFIFCLFNSFALLVISLFVLLVVGRFFTKRYGGFSGDMYGFLIEFSELILLNAVLIQ